MIELTEEDLKNLQQLVLRKRIDELMQEPYDPPEDLEDFNLE